MRICVLYSSPKLGDIILQLPFIKAISDNYKVKVTLCVNKYINIKNILENLSYIEAVIENPFRTKKHFLNDVLNLSKDLSKNKFDIAFILEKTKGTAIACKISKVKKIFGFGIGSQKYFVDNRIRLTKQDLRYNYTQQSINFLEKKKYSC